MMSDLSSGIYSAPVTKERLRSYRRLLTEIALMKDRVAKLTAQAKYAVASFSFAPSHGTANNDKLTEYIIRKDELLDAYLGGLTQASADAAELERAINALTDTRERQVIMLYYIDGLPWHKVAERINYSVDHVYTIHGRALAKLYEITKDASSSQ